MDSALEATTRAFYEKDLEDLRQRVGEMRREADYAWDEAWRLEKENDELRW